MNPLVSPDGQSVLFVYRLGENDEVMVCRLDGSGLRNLSDHPGSDRMATWSADGKSVYFSSDRDGPWHLYRVQPDGTDLRRLTNEPASDIHPRPSPDGTRLLFTRGSDLMLSGADGSAAAKLAPGNGGIWSPDGLWVAYSWRDQVRVIKVDGTERRDLAEGRPLCWTLDGRRIYFARPNFNICDVERTGGDYRLIVPGRVLDPKENRFVWSRDRLVLAVNPSLPYREQSGGVVVLMPDGILLSDCREARTSRWMDESASWTPDGDQIVFARHGRFGWGGILIMKSDGSDVRVVLRDDLTTEPLPSEAPARRSR